MSPRDNSTHVILAVQDYKPKEFATTINLNIKNAWAILKYIIEILQKQMVIFFLSISIYKFSKGW